MSLTDDIREAGIKALRALYPQAPGPEQLTVNETKPEFEGDYTIVLFPLIKRTKLKPQDLGKTIGDWLTAEYGGLIAGYNVISGFLNLQVSDAHCLHILQALQENTSPPEAPGRKIMVEYSSPNTNKPLHLGHLRNNFLGYSISRILKAAGNEVIMANLVNDRGIHICKSMAAWLNFGGGQTPESTGTKGDHFVGDYYVKFNEAYKAQVNGLVQEGKSREEAEKEAPILREAQDLLIKWEQNDPAVRDLWQKMNGWVYEGFDQTYKRMGVRFDRFYYESRTYLLGKSLVEEGLEKRIFFRKEDHSVWVDLTADGLDEKLLLRADGTSVYMTQDLGTAQLKYDDYRPDRSIYVIGDEQNYHMKVLKLILQKLGKPYADGIDHLSYGMVELPHGRMKSREGTVVDADNLMDEMAATAARHTLELGKVQDFSPEELEDLYEILGIGAMKFYLLRVNPKKKMVFNPEESIDFHGFTGPFIQYTYARIKSILRKENTAAGPSAPAADEALLPLERALILHMERYRPALDNAAAEMDPSLLANYIYALAKTFNSFYTAHSVSQAETAGKKSLRLQLCRTTAAIISEGMDLLGIRVPERM